MAGLDVLITIAPAIAKAIYKSIARDPFVAELSDDLYAEIASRGLEYIRLRKSAREVESLADEMAAGLLSLFQREGAPLSRKERIAVLLTLYESLCRDDIDDQLLEEHAFDARRLETYLEERMQRTLRTLSEREIHTFRLLLRETCRRIIRVDTQLRFFKGCPVLLTAEGQEWMLGQIANDALLPDPESERHTTLYLRGLIEHLDRIGSFGLGEESSRKPHRTMNSVFVPPRVSLPTSTLDIGRRGGAHNGIGGESEGKSIQVEQALEHAWRVVVTGSGGSGKTTLLQWLAIRVARRDLPPSLRRLNETIPFFVRLRSFSESGLSSPDHFPRALAEVAGEAMSEHGVRKHLESGRALLLIDGIDEIPPQRRTLLLEKLRSLVSMFPLTHFIISSRPAALLPENWPEWDIWAADAEFRTMEIRPLDEAQIHAMVECWHGAMESMLDDPAERPAARQLGASLSDLIRSRPRLRHLASTPLQCAMLCAVHREQRDRLPSDRADLYEACTLFLLDRHDIEQQRLAVIDTGEITIAVKLLLLEYFAGWLMRGGMSEATIMQTDKRFTELLKGMPLTRAINGSTIRISLAESGALLRESVPGRIEFVHRTFQEYLTARIAAKEEKIDPLLENAQDDQWWETIVFTAALLDVDKRNLLLGKIIERAKPPRRLFRRPEPSEYDRRLMAVAAACLESGIEIDPALREVINAATSTLHTPPALAPAL